MHKTSQPTKRNLRRRTGQTLLLACTSIALVACASSGPDRRGDRGDRGQRSSGQVASVMAPAVAIVFTAMDSNGDRAVSSDELAEGILAEWAFADADASGTISVFEIEAWAAASLGSPNRLPNRLSFDRDLNGQITEVEFNEGFVREFGLLDKNSDQVLSRSELFVAVRSRGGGDEGESRGQNGRGGQGRGGGRRRGG